MRLSVLAKLSYVIDFILTGSVVAREDGWVDVHVSLLKKIGPNQKKLKKYC